MERMEGAHQHSRRHRQEIERSQLCGCFYCGAQFPPGRIERWLDDNDTAVCPECGIDSVIGSASGFPISNEFLQEMRRYWFEGPEGNEGG
jgi:hypothetical protein